MFVIWVNDQKVYRWILEMQVWAGEKRWVIWIRAWDGTGTALGKIEF